LGCLGVKKKTHGASEGNWGVFDKSPGNKTIAEVLQKRGTASPAFPQNPGWGTLGKIEGWRRKKKAA